jgi:hypothetical protein
VWNVFIYVLPCFKRTYMPCDCLSIMLPIKCCKFVDYLHVYLQRQPWAGSSKNNCNNVMLTCNWDGKIINLVLTNLFPIDACENVLNFNMYSQIGLCCIQNKYDNIPSEILKNGTNSQSMITDYFIICYQKAIDLIARKQVCTISR